MKTLRIAFALMLLAAFVAGAVLSLRPLRSPDPAKRPSIKPHFLFYTAQTATTPQLSFWAAAHAGDFEDLFSFDVETWRDLDTLKALLLSGKGDLWLGHLEGFALAKKNGAPLSLLAITAWKKFYLLSVDSAVNEFLDCPGHTVAYTPKASPAISIARAILGPQAAEVRFIPQELAELAHHLSDGTYHSALVPEPLAAMLLGKIPGLRRVSSLEETYGRTLGRPHRLPLAGLAVNTDTAARYPGAVQGLLQALSKQGKLLAHIPDVSLELLPQSVRSTVGSDVLRESLRYDLIHVEEARSVEQEILDYLRIVVPEVFSADGRLTLDSSFIWHSEGGA